jgi:hypothetical protein
MSSSPGVSVRFNTLESARIAGVLESALERLYLVSSLPPSLMSSDSSGDEIKSALEEQRMLEQRYNDLANQRIMAKAAKNKVKVAEVNASLVTVSEGLRFALQNLSRILREAPDAQTGMIKLIEERTALVSLLQSALSELRESGGCTVLSSYCAKEAAARAAPGIAAAREDELDEQIQPITSEIEAYGEAQELALAAKRRDVEELSRKLAAMRGENSLTLRFTRKEMTASLEVASKLAGMKREDLQAEIALLKRKFAEEQEASDLSADILKAEVAALAGQLEAFKAKVPVDLAQAEEELAIAKAARAASAEDLAKLTARFQEDSQEATKILVRPAPRRQAGRNMLTPSSPPSLLSAQAEGQKKNEKRRQELQLYADQEKAAIALTAILQPMCVRCFGHSILHHPHAPHPFFAQVYHRQLCPAGGAEEKARRGRKEG